MSVSNIIRPNAKGNPVALPVIACDDFRTLADIRRASDNPPAGPTSPKPPQARAARAPFPNNRQVDRTAWRNPGNRPTSSRETIRPHRRLRRFSRLPAAPGRTSLPDVLRSAKGKMAQGSCSRRLGFSAEAQTGEVSTNGKIGNFRNGMRLVAAARAAGNCASGVGALDFRACHA